MEFNTSHRLPDLWDCSDNIHRQSVVCQIAANTDRPGQLGSDLSKKIAANSDQTPGQTNKIDTTLQRKFGNKTLQLGMQLQLHYISDSSAC